jgi:hypothetical protein
MFTNNETIIDWSIIKTSFSHQPASSKQSSFKSFSMSAGQALGKLGNIVAETLFPTNVS